MITSRLILVPQFEDRGGNTVFHVFAEDPECRTLRAGKMLGMLRFDGVELFDFELCEQGEIDGLEAPQ